MTKGVKKRLQTPINILNNMFYKAMVKNKILKKDTTAISFFETLFRD